MRNSIWTYVWYPAIILLWVALHFYIPTDPDTYTAEQIQIAEMNLSVSDLNFTNMYTTPGKTLDMKTVINSFVTTANMMIWKYAYYGVWLWMILGLFEYLSQFNAKWWWYKKMAREIYINYSFVIIMGYVVIFWL